MSVSHHPHSAHPKKRQFWQREESILAASVALLAFGLVYAYSGYADLFYPLISALGMGTAIYTAASLAIQRKIR